MESNPGDSNERPQQPEESKNEQLRKIKVKTIDNQVFSLEVPPSILIGEFKKELEKKANVPADRQRLIYMAKVLHDEQPLNTIVNEDDQTIHLLAKTQSAAPTGPQTQPQAQGQSQPQGQPSQQNDPNAQNRANLGPAGAFFRVGGLPDLGGIINGLIGNVSGLGGGAFGPGMVNLGAQPGQPGQNPQGQNQAPTGPQQGQPGPQVQANPLGGNASIMGLNFAISASTDPNDPNRVLVNQPQVRVISSGPLDPSALLGQQQQQQQQGQPQGNAPGPNILGGLLGQGAQPGVQGAGPGGRTVIELPHRHVFNIGSIVNSLMGQNTAFPGPPMPQLGFPRNSLALLGGYLYNYQFQMMRLMPFLSRLADLLQRESLITNPNERHQVELLAHAVGHALDEVAQATTPVVHLFRNVQVGTSPGDFRIRPSQQQQQQAGPQPSAVPLPNLQSGSPLNIARVFGGLNPQFQQRAQNEAQNQPGSQPSGVGAQARPQEQGSREDRMEIVDETEQFFNRGQQRPQPEPTQQRQEQQQQQAPRAGAAPQTQPQGQGNIMGGMLGQMMGMGPGLMDQTLGSFFGDREMETEDDEHIMSILGLLTVGDFFALLTAGNASCFDRIHFNMRDVIRKMLDKNGGSREALAKSWAKTISKYFEPEEQHRSRVMEGFEPHTVAEEISTKHFIGIIDAILKDYLPPHKFSDAFVNDFKIYIRELISEISEGLYDGMNDFELILKERFKNEVSNMAPGMEGLVMSMVWPQLWQKILRLYQQEASANQAGVTEPERELDDVEREEALLKEIAEVLREDNEMEPPPGQPAFSEAYMKGDMNYEEKK